MTEQTGFEAMASQYGRSQIIDRLKTILNNQEIYDEYPGCVVINVEREGKGYALWFGTANETIGASVVSLIGGDSYIETDLASDCRIEETVANVIASAVKNWCAQHPALDNWLQVRREFSDAALRLSEAYEDGSWGTVEYPFSESFDDVAIGILRWAQADGGAQ